MGRGGQIGGNVHDIVKKTSRWAKGAAEPELGTHPDPSLFGPGRGQALSLLLSPARRPCREAKRQAKQKQLGKSKANFDSKRKKSLRSPPLVIGLLHTQFAKMVRIIDIGTKAAFEFAGTLCSPMPPPQPLPVWCCALLTYQGVHSNQERWNGSKAFRRKGTPQFAQRHALENRRVRLRCATAHLAPLHQGPPGRSARRLCHRGSGPRRLPGSASPRPAGCDPAPSRAQSASSAAAAGHGFVLPPAQQGEPRRPAPGFRCELHRRSALAAAPDLAMGVQVASVRPPSEGMPHVRADGCRGRGRPFRGAPCSQEPSRWAGLPARCRFGADTPVCGQHSPSSANHTRAP